MSIASAPSDVPPESAPTSGGAAVQALLTRLRNETEQSRKAINAKQQELATALDEIAKLRAHDTEHRGRASELEYNNRILVERNHELEHKLVELEKKNRELEHEASRLGNNNQQLEQKLSELERNKGEREGKASASEQTIGELEGKTRELEARARELEQRLAEQASDAERARTESEALRSQLAAARAEPPSMPAPRDGDDLTAIRGIGPKFEKVLRAAGICRYAEIAAWTDAEIESIAPKLKVRPERIRREQWIERAKELAGSNG